MAIPQISDWRERILAGVGVKPTQENLRFMDAWARAEGGTATNNPFNTTQRMPGSTFYNQLGGGIGVQNFTNVQQGIDATVNTLTNGRYGNIIGALRQGDDAMKAAAALAASPWGTGGLVQKILGGGGETAPAPAAPAGAGSLGATVASQMQPPALGSTPAPAAAAPQQSPIQSFTRGMAAAHQQTAMSPAAVRLLANLGDATKAVTEARQQWDSNLGFDEDAAPVTRTLTTMQTGSTDSKFKTLDLGVDFDGPIHPNAEPIVNMARQFLGTPYLWGGADPRKGFDCSGFVQYLYAQAGISTGRTTYDQVKHGEPVREVSDLMPGDVVFFSKAGDVHHEGLYIGGGQFIHAPRTGDVVKISSLSDSYYAKEFLMGRRFIAAGDAPKA